MGSDVSQNTRTISARDAGPRQSAVRTALAGLIGNVLEWFDFAVYGYFASDIGRQFFPQSSHAAQQLLTFGVFALGFLRAAVRQPGPWHGWRPDRPAGAADAVDRS